MLKKAIIYALFAVLSTAGSYNLAEAKSIIRIGIGDPLDSGAGQYGVKFKEIVEAKTKGKTKVELFPNGELGDEDIMLQEVKDGTLDMCVVGIGNAVPSVPPLRALTLPYFLENEKAVVTATTGKLFDYFNEVSIKRGNLRILGYTYTNYRHLTNSKRAVTKLSDIKGLKLRVPNNPVFIDTFAAWGANPQAMGWNETYTALQTGVVDGQDNPYVVNATMNFQEVQKYVTELHYHYSLQPLFVGERHYAKYPASLRKIIEEAAMEAQMYILDWENANSAKARATMEKAGVKVSTLKDEDEWKKKAMETWSKHYKDIGGKEVIDMIQAEIAKGQ